MDEIKRQILMDLLECGKIVPNPIYPNVPTMYTIVQLLIKEGFIRRCTASEYIRDGFYYKLIPTREIEALFYGSSTNT
jgi:hypothetical protein